MIRSCSICKEIYEFVKSKRGEEAAKYVLKTYGEGILAKIEKDEETRKSLIESMETEEPSITTGEASSVPPVTVTTPAPQVEGETKTEVKAMVDEKPQAPAPEQVKKEEPPKADFTEIQKSMDAKFADLITKIDAQIKRLDELDTRLKAIESKPAATIEKRGKDSETNQPADAKSVMEELRKKILKRETKFY